MKISLKVQVYVLFFLIGFLTSQKGTSQTWNQISDFPGMQRDDGTSFVIGNTAWCGTGNLPTGVGSVDFYTLNMDTDAWSVSASLPSGKERQYACGFSNADYGFIFGGYNTGNFFNDLWQYNPTSNSWIEKTPLPGPGRSASAHFVIGDTAYIVCGKTSTDYAIDEVWAYNMVNDSWEQKNDFPFGNRWRSCGASSPTNGYLVFGKDETLSYPTGLYEYDPVADSWTQMNNFPGTGRSHSKAVFFSGNLVLLTGYDSLGMSYNDMWRYDLTDDAWYQLNSIPAVGRRAGMCFTSSTALYYAAGINASHVRIKETWKNINPTTVSENSEQAEFRIYPNPASSYFELRGEGILSRGHISICDLTGKIFLETGFESDSRIEIPYLETGTYCVHVQFENGTSANRLLIVE